MAAYDILTWSSNNREKRIPSQSNTFNFQSVTIGTDALAITEVSSTAFGFGSNLLSNVADPLSNQDAATKHYVDSQSSSGANTSLSNLASTAVNVTVSPGTDGAINLGSVTKRWLSIFVETAVDSSSVVQVDFTNRHLKDGSGVVSEDWGARTLIDASSNTSVDWGGYFLKNSGTTMLDWSSTNVSVNSRKITNVNNPTLATDAATKAYVDAVATGLTVKASVQAATTAALASNTYNNGTAGVGATLTATANGPIAAIDGYTPVLNDRLLIKNEVAGANNGIYSVTQVGTSGGGGTPYILTRTTDADTCQPASNPTVTSGMLTFIEEGTANVSTGWVLTTPDPITLGTTSLAFSKFSAPAQLTAGSGITITSNQINVNVDNASLVIVSNQVQVQLDGSTLSSSGSGLRVANNGITATQLNTSVAGNGLTGGGGSPLAVESADASINVASGGVSVNYSETRTNDNAGTISAGQIVYVKSTGHVDLATATAQDNTAFLGAVQAATIATTASGTIYEKHGALVGGFTGLTVGSIVYLGTTAGAAVQTLSGFSAGNFVWKLGVATSSTTIEWCPEFIIEY